MANIICEGPTYLRPMYNLITAGSLEGHEKYWNVNITISIEIRALAEITIAVLYDRPVLSSLAGSEQFNLARYP